VVKTSHNGNGFRLDDPNALEVKRVLSDVIRWYPVILLNGFGSGLSGQFLTTQDFYSVDERSHVCKPILILNLSAKKPGASSSSVWSINSIYEKTQTI